MYSTWSIFKHDVVQQTMRQSTSITTIQKSLSQVFPFHPLALLPTISLIKLAIISQQLPWSMYCTNAFLVTIYNIIFYCVLFILHVLYWVNSKRVPMFFAKSHFGYPCFNLSQFRYPTHLKILQGHTELTTKSEKIILPHFI